MFFDILIFYGNYLYDFVHICDFDYYYYYFDYFWWVLWLIYPALLLFILPILILFFIYASALFLWVFNNYYGPIQEAYHNDFWDGARMTLAAFWVGQGTLFHGWRRIMEVFRVIPGSVQSCVDVVSQNNLLAIAPGGVREALFGDEEYGVLWEKRIGFARVAIEANVPVIPMFTENCREAFRTLKFGRALLRKLYEKTRLPIVPLYGLFPVKLITHFGDPIFPPRGISAEQFKDLVKLKLEQLISQHQSIPGSIPRALLQRIWPKSHNS